MLPSLTQGASEICFVEVLIPAVHAINQRCLGSKRSGTCCTSKRAMAFMIIA